MPRPERYDLFRRPEKYLVTRQQQQQQQQQQQPMERWDQQARQTLLQEYFYKEAGAAETEVLQIPEIEGPLWIKSEGKKNWKKFYFVLRPNGIYYTPKVGKNKALATKDLILLTSFESDQVYLGVGWKKKYKSPTDSCFALKSPQIQVKSPKNIRYLCAESDVVLYQWTTAIRIIKNRQMLLENYNNLLVKMQTGTGKEELYAALRYETDEADGAGNKQQQQQGVEGQQSLIEVHLLCIKHHIREISKHANLSLFYLLHRFITTSMESSNNSISSNISHTPPEIPAAVTALAVGAGFPPATIASAAAASARLPPSPRTALTRSILTEAPSNGSLMLEEEEQGETPPLPRRDW